MTLSLLAVCVAALSGCAPEPAPEPQASSPTLSVEEYVAHMAALAVAVEEGLSGEPAAARALELGGGGHTREEVERFTDAMSRRPEVWAGVEAEVVERIREIKRTDGGA